MVAPIYDYDRAANGVYEIRRSGRVVMLSNDEQLAQHLVERASAGEINDVDWIYEETGKPDAAWCFVWCAIVGLGAVALFGLYRLGAWALGMMF